MDNHQQHEHHEPHQYPERTLVVVSGMSPQILTETLYALVKTQQPAFVPTTVHLLSTASGAKHARLTLLEGDAHFKKLCNDYGIDSGIFSASNIHTITDADGNPLEDIRSPADNAAAADFITGFIRQQTANPESAVHVSMAGGRKTMGYYAGYALSLYGRVQDRLSHVLVSEGFEGQRDFYYPTPKSHPIYRDGKVALDASEAKVELAEIPFVRLREELPEEQVQAHALLSGTHSFADAIRAAELARQPHHIVLNMQEMKFTCNGSPLQLGTTSLLLLCWLAHRQHNDLKELPYGNQCKDSDFQAYGEDFFAFCAALDARDQALQVEAEKAGQNRKLCLMGISRTMESVIKGFGSDDIAFRNSRLQKEMRSTLGSRPAEELQPKNIGSRGKASLSIVDFDQNYTVIPLDHQPSIKGNS